LKLRTKNQQSGKPGWLDEQVESEFLATLLQKPDGFDRFFLNEIKPEFFQVDSYQWLIRVICDNDWKPFALGLLEQELLDVKDEEKKERYKAQITNLFERTLTFSEEAVKKFKGYMAFCAINLSVSESFQAYTNTGRIDYLLQSVKEGAIHAEDLLNDSSLKILDYAERYDQRQETRRLERTNPTITPKILTGIRGIDSQFEIKAPMLVDFLAPFKRYKSVFLNAMGFSALLQGFNVLHVVFENTVELTEDRYDAMFAHINYDRVRTLALTQDEKYSMDYVFNWINGWQNRLKIVKCTPFDTTVAQVEEDLEKFRNRDGFSPDVEIWDYLNIIAPSKKITEERLQQRQIVWDLKNHAEKWNVAVIEASQTNMEGANAERLEMGHRGKSIDISQGINLCIAINQTEQERDDGIIVLSPMFSRERPIIQPEIVLDSDIPRMLVSRELLSLWDQAKIVNPLPEQ